MIQIFAPCYLPFNPQTILHGSMGNTMLSDPTMCSIDVGVHVLLNPVIGDDLLVSSSDGMIQMYKAYDMLGNTLFEYSLFQIKVTGTDELHFIPISVKRYDSTMPYTFLFTRGVTLALDMLRGARNYNIISATMMAKMFNGTPVTPVDKMFSIELPSTMEYILSELGSYALHDPTNSDITMRMVFEELTKSYDQLLAYDRPKDLISYYGCMDANYIPLSTIQSNLSASSNMFYSKFVEDIQSRLQERKDRMIPLDYQQTIFHALMVKQILNELYQAPYTDISMIVEQSGARDVHMQRLFGIQRIEPVSAGAAWSNMPSDISIATYLHDGLIHYNQHQLNKISMIVFCKNWMDDLHIDVYMEDGTCLNFYLNMALYHLYSPSIVRMHQQVI